MKISRAGRTKHDTMTGLERVLIWIVIYLFVFQTAVQVLYI